ncbi:HAD hydrolase-like protein [Planosporangium thailandense]|uniref:HAD hydrolase-like protein n=1 Tax=Planosporangium thailandense TaxID=765197 RepID=A0ABX0Y7T1_9ACTN|nr:haloacid dehalogenase-like hydrolase [Planosporangium thailandense]NJC74088.1 HAD hydrolase-like protein [Planosporangium thailandense]
MATDRPALLVLWDVDHTLIDTAGVGRQLYHAAFEAVTGRHLEHEADPTGRTEQAIFRETLDRHAIPTSPPLEAAYRVELPRQYQQHLNQLQAKGYALPGASEALHALTQRPGVVQTVLSGNYRQVAITKLKAFGLDQHVDFHAGAYGEDDTERAKLVPIAQERARTRYGQTFDRANTVIIGDSEGDIQAAQVGGAQIIAVATGRDSADALRRAGAAVVLADLTNTGALIRAITRISER